MGDMGQPISQEQFDAFDVLAGTTSPTENDARFQAFVAAAGIAYKVCEMHANMTPDEYTEGPPIDLPFTITIVVKGNEDGTGLMVQGTVMNGEYMPVCDDCDKSFDLCKCPDEDDGVFQEPDDQCGDCGNTFDECSCPDDICPACGELLDNCDCPCACDGCQCKEAGTTCQDSIDPPTVNGEVL